MASVTKEAKVEVSLARDLGLFEITMIGIGPTIGSTIFLLLGVGTFFAGPAIILAFALNFVVTAFTAMAYMELGSAFPETGGGYLWVKNSMPQPFGFLGGWMSWFGHCIVASFYIYGFGFGFTWLMANYGVLPLGQCVAGCPFDVIVLRKLAAVGVGTLFIFINYRGVSTTGRTESVITGILIGVVSIFIVAALVVGLQRPDVPRNFTPFIPNGPGSIIVAMGFTFIVFEGYEIIAQAGEECENPEVNIPKAHFFAIAIPTAIFILMGVGAIAAANPALIPGMDPMLPGWKVVAGLREFALAEVARQVIPWYGIGFVLMVAGVIVGSIAAINSVIFSSSRVSFAMGRDGSLPARFGRVHEAHRTPAFSILVSGLIISIMTLVLPIETVAGSADIMFLLLFLLVNVAVIILRVKRPDVKRWYRMPLFPLVPLAGIATKFVLAVSLWAVEPTAWVIAGLWISVGALMFYFYKGREEIAEIPQVRRMELLEVLASRGTEVDKGRFRILLPLRDFSDEHLVKVASLLAAEKRAELVLMHIVEVPSTLPPKNMRFSLVDDKIKELNQLERLVSRDVDTRSILKISHRIYETILATVREEHVDLLVLSWRGDRPSSEKRILGTNIDYLVQRAPCDVLVLKTKGMKDHLESILVMSGHTWHTSYATSMAVVLAKAWGSRVTILSVAPNAEVEEAERRYAERLAAICEGAEVPYEVKAVRDSNILEVVAREAPAHDLLVMGASTAWVLRKYAFGEMEDRIAKRVNIPVLMLRKVARPGVVSEEELLSQPGGTALAGSR